MRRSYQNNILIWVNLLFIVKITMVQGDTAFISEHSSLLFISTAGGELLLWGQIPCVSQVSDHPGLKRVRTPQPVPLAGRKVCACEKDCANYVFRLLKSQGDESLRIF